jgi:D-aspartate ligase
MRRVLILSGDSPFALAVVRAFRNQTDWQVSVLGKHFFCPAGFSRYCRQKRVLRPSESDKDFADRNPLLEVIQEVQADLLLPVDIPNIRLVIEHRKSIEKYCRVGLVPSLESFLIANDKSDFLEFTQRNSIPHPRSLIIRPSEIDSLIEELSGFRFPILLKHPQSGYGRGIHRVETIDELMAICNREFNKTDNYIAQEEVPGTDIDCSVLCFNGDVVASTVQRPILTNTRDFAPAPVIEIIDDPKALRLAQNIVHRLNWNGVAHIDLRYDNRTGEVFVIEMNPRCWGSLEASTRSGVNFPLLWSKISLGEPIAKPNPKHVRYANGSSIPRLYSSKLEKEQKRFSLRETAIADWVRDPLPTLMELFQKIF